MPPAYHSDVPGSPSNAEDGVKPQSPALRATPLLAEHERLGATLTGFAGWQMPLRYGSETAEHQAVRQAAGLFDLSHMGEITVTGPEAAAALDYALTGTLAAVAPVLAELQSRASGFTAQVTDRTEEYALIALQGPEAVGILAPLTDLDLGEVRYYAGYPGTVAGRPVFVARTGYTGEDGFELFTAAGDAEPVWTALAAAGAPAGLVPAGLAARDTLRLEAGMPLYGNELGPDMTPYDAGLGRVVKLDKPGGFVGGARPAERGKAGPERVLAGLTLASRRVPRHGYTVLAGGQPAGAGGRGAPSPARGRPR